MLPREWSIATKRRDFVLRRHVSRPGVSESISEMIFFIMSTPPSNEIISRPVYSPTREVSKHLRRWECQKFNYSATETTSQPRTDVSRTPHRYYVLSRARAAVSDEATGGGRHATSRDRAVSRAVTSRLYARVTSFH
ncbi:hypothetical protein EVAR_95249_1 [Eumeta japonica]|uniref:Uncharacterized protein n=1 Tax=Eumeta variegata TaxID=151549 RepID=A0A4C1UJY4_EUMVA|nr:hypothetical protein EVAR_95249_1 [Eumeta japonica]